MAAICGFYERLRHDFRDVCAFFRERIYWDAVFVYCHEIRGKITNQWDKTN